MVHSHRESVSWGDLFRNIHFNFATEKSVEGYVNGAKVTNIFVYPIKPYDSVVIFFGKVDRDLLKSGITKDRIIGVEKESGGC